MNGKVIDAENGASQIGETRVAASAGFDAARHLLMPKEKDIRDVQTGYMWIHEKTSPFPSVRSAGKENSRGAMLPLATPHDRKSGFSRIEIHCVNNHLNALFGKTAATESAKTSR
ncbi:MAG: hypothetical protein LBD68_08595 [Zoogloeaceae bacterium]|jgi:hypothetical protein|nr:hypothetical protein [Zoogloeaceae bacterium]